MQKFCATKYIMIGLSVISLSLSGMSLTDKLTETKQPDYIIILKPVDGYFNVTEENRPQFQKTPNFFCINLVAYITKIISVEQIKQTNKKNHQDKAYIVRKNNLAINLIGGASKNEANFKYHNKLLTTNLIEPTSILATTMQEAQRAKADKEDNSIRARAARFITQYKRELMFGGLTTAYFATLYYYYCYSRHQINEFFRTSFGL